MAERDWLRLAVVSAGAEYLVMGQLMRRNILTYKAPPNNEGYDLICIHPDPRHIPKPDERAQIRVQVKSRYATDCDRGFPVKEASLGAFDFLVANRQNIVVKITAKTSWSFETVRTAKTSWSQCSS